MKNKLVSAVTFCKLPQTNLWHFSTAFSCKLLANIHTSANVFNKIIFANIGCNVEV